LWKGCPIGKRQKRFGPGSIGNTRCAWNWRISALTFRSDVAFRARLIQGGGEALLFEKLLAHAKEQGWLKARGRQRTDSTHVLAAIETLSRLECVAETFRQAWSAAVGHYS